MENAYVKRKVDVEIRNFPVNTISFFDTIWKERKKTK